MDKKLNNLLSFSDFEKSWKPDEQKKTKRTEIGLDIVKESKSVKTQCTHCGHKQTSQEKDYSLNYVKCKRCGKEGELKEIKESKLEKGLTEKEAFALSNLFYHKTGPIYFGVKKDSDGYHVIFLPTKKEIKTFAEGDKLEKEYIKKNKKK